MEVEAIVAALRKRAEDLNGINPGAANDLRIFLATGKMPVTTAGQAALQSIVAGTPYAQNPSSLLQAANALANQRNTPEDYGAVPGGAPAGAAPGAPSAPAVQPTSGGTGGADLPDDQLARIAAALADQQRKARGGISAADDNGIGGGGPEGDAAARALVQQGANRAGTAAAGFKPASSTYNTTPTSAGMGPTSGGGYTPGQAEVLSQDDDQLIRFAMQQAGLNPDRLTKYSKIAGRALVPLLRARRAAFGIAGDGNVGGLPDDIAGVAKSFTSGNGTNFYDQQRQYGQQAMQSENFKNAIAGLGDQEQVAAMFQSLMPLTYAGSNPLIQQSAADTFNRQQNQFNDAQFNGPLAGKADPSGGIFTQFLQNQQNLDPITKRIFGLR